MRNDPVGLDTPSHGLINLPQIGKVATPFTGFINTSITTDKMRYSYVTREAWNRSVNTANNTIGVKGDISENRGKSVNTNE